MIETVTEKIRRIRLYFHPYDGNGYSKLYRPVYKSLQDAIEARDRVKEKVKDYKRLGKSVHEYNYVYSCIISEINWWKNI